MRAPLITFVLTITASSALAAGAPTFSKDVAPILFQELRRVPSAHRDGAVSLMTYEDARPWARAIKQKVTTRQMPPWGADPTVAKYSNDVSLKQAEIDTIAAWVDGGAPEGNRANCRRRPRSPRAGPSASPITCSRCSSRSRVPADGTVPYLYVTIPTNLKEDIWIAASSSSRPIAASCTTSSATCWRGTGPRRIRSRS